MTTPNTELTDGGRRTTPWVTYVRGSDLVTHAPDVRRGTRCEYGCILLPSIVVVSQHLQLTCRRYFARRRSAQLHAHWLQRRMTSAVVTARSDEGVTWIPGATWSTNTVVGVRSLVLQEYASMPVRSQLYDLYSRLSTSRRLSLSSQWFSSIIQNTLKRQPDYFNENRQPTNITPHLVILPPQLSLSQTNESYNLRRRCVPPCPHSCQTSLRRRGLE